MSLWKIAWRNIEQRWLSSLLTSLSMALGVALVVVVLLIYSTLEAGFGQNAQGYHLIVGAKGSPLQLVLNTVFHLSRPIENIPYSFYKEFTEGRFAPMVEAAIPCCMGDNYRGFRVVGTTPAMFEALEYAPGKRYEFAEGRNFRRENYFEGVLGAYAARQTGLKIGDTFRPTHGVTVDAEQGHQHDAFRVVGILAPTGTANDRAIFINMEGFYLLEDHAKPLDDAQAPSTEAGEHHHADDPRDAAAMADHEAGDTDGDAHEHSHDDNTAHTGHDEPAGASHEHSEDHRHSDAHQTEHHDDHADGHAAANHEHDHSAADHEHDHAHAPLPESQREVTAILLLLKNDLYAQSLYTTIQEGQVAQAVFPAKEVYTLFTTFVGPIRMVFLLMAMLIVLVAGVGIMVSIYNSMNDRRRDIAVMRALGADRRQVRRIVLLESILLSLAGGAVGIALGHLAIAGLSPIVMARSGVSIASLQFETQAYLSGLPWLGRLGGDWWAYDFLLVDLGLIPLLVVLASLVGLLPAGAAYRTDVAKALTATP